MDSKSRYEKKSQKNLNTIDFSIWTQKMIFTRMTSHQQFCCIELCHFIGVKHDFWVQIEKE